MGFFRRKKKPGEEDEVEGDPHLERSTKPMVQEVAPEKPAEPHEEGEATTV